MANHGDFRIDLAREQQLLLAHEVTDPRRMPAVWQSNCMISGVVGTDYCVSVTLLAAARAAAASIRPRSSASMNSVTLIGLVR